MKILGHFVVSAVVAGLLFLAGYYCLNSAMRLEGVQARLDILKAQARLRQVQDAELDQQQRLAVRTERLLARAKELGLNPATWAYYRVNLQEQLEPNDLDHIIGQCANSPAYFFRPVQLTVKTRKGQEKMAALPGEASPTQPQTPAAPPASSLPAGKAPVGGQGDFQVTVQGSFIVRPN